MICDLLFFPFVNSARDPPRSDLDVDLGSVYKERGLPWQAGYRYAFPLAFVIVFSRQLGLPG